MDTNVQVFRSLVPKMGRVAKTEERLFKFALGGHSADIWKGSLESGFEIYKAAIKVVKGDQDTVTRNRLRERRVLATLHHPNIRPGVSFNLDRHKMPSLVFPYYRHGDILRYPKSHPNVDELSLIAQVADAVAYTHNIFVVHSDIKVSNIYVSLEGKALICDGGLAWISQTSGFRTKTSQATWRYSAPEMLISDDICQRHGFTTHNVLLKFRCMPIIEERDWTLLSWCPWAA